MRQPRSEPSVGPGRPWWGPRGGRILASPTSLTLATLAPFSGQVRPERDRRVSYWPRVLSVVLGGLAVCVCSWPWKPLCPHPSLTPGRPGIVPGDCGSLVWPEGAVASQKVGTWPLLPARLQGLEVYLQGREFQSPFILDEDQARELLQPQES